MSRSNRALFHTYGASALLLTALLNSASSFGQNQVVVHLTGQVLPCSPLITTVTVASISGVSPPVNITLPTDSVCTFSADITMDDPSGLFLVSTSCGGGFSAIDTVPYLGNFLDTVAVTVVLLCPGAEDCEGVPNGPALPGTPCDDNDPLTVNDTWDADCNCVGNVPGVCDAAFWPIQAYYIDSVTGDPVPLFHEVWLIDQSTSTSGTLAYAWDFGDGGTSTDAQPVHVYGGPGPYAICLSVADSSGCTNVFCDSVTVDGDGLLSGMVGGDGARNGFTVRVVDPLTVSIPQAAAPEDVRLWPVPAQDVQQLSFSSPTAGTARLELVAMDGRLLAQRHVALVRGVVRVAVPLDELPSGPFLIRLTTATWTLQQRSMKQ